jgi:RNA polymerase sigma factor (sigma-70 family)
MATPMTDAGRPVPIETLLTHRAWVDALARRLLADESSADDAAQETWLAALRHPPGDEATARSWLGRVLRNFAHERRRTDARRGARERVSARPETSGGDVAAVVAQAELHKKLVLAVMDLEEPYRATVLLRFFEGLEPREVAARMGVPVETVRTRTRRAVEQLRERLDREHGGERRAWAVWVTGIGSEGGVPRAARRAGSAAAAGAAIGGLVMGKKAVIAAAVLVLVAIGTWTATRPGDEHSPRPAPPPLPTAPVAASPRVAPEKAPAPQPPDAKPPAPASPFLAGRVVDATGRGVAGAAVVASPVISNDAPSPKLLPSAVTDATGAFRVEVGDDAPMWTVFADAPGGAHGRSVPRRPGDGVIVTVAEGASLAGHVSGPDGRPVAGASVRWISTFDATRLVRRAVTGADGAFGLSGLPSGQRSSGWITASDSTIAVDAQGFAPLTAVQPDDLGTPLELRLSLGALVTGRVVDAESGAPVAGARVVLLNFQHPDAAGDGFVARGGSSAPAGETRSDAEGRYRFEHVACAGVHFAPLAPGGRKGPVIGSVGAFAEGYAAADDEVPVPKDGETVVTELRLWAAAAIEGRVVDAAGRPMPGFRVSDWATDRRHAWLPASAGVPAARGATDAEGRYRIDGVPVPRTAAATTTLYAHPSDSSVAMGFTPPHVDVEVRAGETAHAPDLVTGADAPASAWVEVVDDAGRPVWGAKARLDAREEATSGRDGRLRFWFTYNRAGIPPHVVTLQIRAPGFVVAATPEFVPSATEPPSVRVQLARGVRMTGRMLFSDGSPATGAFVTVIAGEVPLARAFDNHGLPAGFDGRMPPDLPRVIFVGSATAAPDGTFEIDGLPRGRVHLRANSEKGGVAVAENVASDATDVLLTLNAHPDAERGDAELAVVDETSGEALPGATALLHRPGGSAWVQGVDTADAPGVVRFNAVVAGMWNVRVEHAGHVTREASITITPGEAAKGRVALARGATVRGRVVVPPDLTLENAIVVLVPAPHRTGSTENFHARPASDGTFEIDGVPAGRWSLYLWRGPGANPLLAAEAAAEVEARPGAVAVADVRAVRAYNASFVVGEPKTYTSIGNVPAIGTFHVTDAGGRTVVSGDVRLPGMAVPLQLPEGRFTLTVALDGASPVERTIDVTTGTNETVRLPLPAGTKAADGR